MDFNKFQSVCKYLHLGCDTCCGSDFYPTCRRPDRIPRGSSWGICEKKYCPYYGEKFNEAVLYIEEVPVVTLKSGTYFLHL